MIKRTMQEWADFTGCPVEVERDGDIWVMTDVDLLEESAGMFLGDFLLRLPNNIVSDADTHDWRILVKPHTEILCPSCGKPLEIELQKGTLRPMCENCGAFIPKKMFNELNKEKI